MKLIKTSLNEKNNSTKNIIFSILTKEYPLKTIEITNIIRKRYGKSISFQGVKKAIIELLEEQILINENNKYKINKNWVLENKNYLDELYKTLTKENKQIQKIESIQDEITVFTFETPNAMMKFWEDIIDNWYKNFKNKDPNYNCYQGTHLWEGLLHPDKEKTIMQQLKKKKIISYSLTTGNTILDKLVNNFYKKMGLNSIISSSNSTFDKSYYVGTYGETIVQAIYPKIIVKKLDKFFKKNKSFETLNLNELADIVNTKCQMKLTVIKNLEMAKHINESIISQF